ncbi:MAG: SpoIID/LytB domain-containing protein, partial [Planctomycetaceae bacterium]
QKYLGFQYRSADGRRLAGESDDSRRIARETAGRVCVDRGELFCTYYSAVCGGRTTPGRAVFADAAPPLQSVPCEWCAAAERSRWTVTVPKATLASRIERHFASRDQPFGSLRSLRQRSPSSPGAAAVFEADDGRRRYELSGADLRGLLPGGTLPSPRFEIRRRGEQFVFEGRGHGHGVGFCQWGARGLALAGRSPTEIIEYYYPGCRVVVLSSASPR